MLNYQCTSFAQNTHTHHLTVVTARKIVRHTHTHTPNILHIYTYPMPYWTHKCGLKILIKFYVLALVHSDVI